MIEEKASKDYSQIRLFVVFIALQSFRYCFLRISEWLLADSTIPAFSQPLVLPYYLAIFSGILFFMLFAKNSEFVLGNGFARLALVASLIVSILSLQLSGIPKIILMFTGFFLDSMLICLCMRSIAIQIKFATLCRFVAFSFAIYHVIGGLCLFLQDTQQTFQMIILGIFPVLALLLWIGGKDKNAAPDIDHRLEPPPPKDVVSKFAVVLILYGFISGIMYNTYFIKEGKVNEPGLYFLTLMCCGVIYVVTGILLDKARWQLTVISLFSLVIIGQILSFFFSQDSVLALPFSYLTLAGFIALDAVSIIIPMYYMKKQKKYSLAAIGYAFLYGGLFVTTLLLKSTSEELYRVILGVMLIASPIAMTLVFMISSSYMKMQSDMRAGITDGIEDERFDSIVQGHGFTNRETEVMRYLLDGCQNNQIAEKMFITENTVYKYISSMIAKTETKSRSGLIAMFTTRKP